MCTVPTVKAGQATPAAGMVAAGNKIAITCNVPGSKIRQGPGNTQIFNSPLICNNEGKLTDGTNQLAYNTLICDRMLSKLIPISVDYYNVELIIFSMWIESRYSSWQKYTTSYSFCILTFL